MGTVPGDGGWRQTLLLRTRTHGGTLHQCAHGGRPYLAQWRCVLLRIRRTARLAHQGGQRPTMPWPCVLHRHSWWLGMGKKRLPTGHRLRTLAQTTCPGVHRRTMCFCWHVPGRSLRRGVFHAPEKPNRMYRCHGGLLYGEAGHDQQIHQRDVPRILRP